MKTPFAIALSLSVAVLLAACNKEEPSHTDMPAAPAEQPAAEPTPMPSTPAESTQMSSDAASAASDSEAAATTPREVPPLNACSAPCGDGSTASIECSAEQVAVCDCSMDPRAKCEDAPKP